ncbi:hypothetical protein J0H58_36265 [bacterium]|nr:hypothetical protein [bacterium]
MPCPGGQAACPRSTLNYATTGTWNAPPRHVVACNFVTRHAPPRVPPALKAGVTGRVWAGEELVERTDTTQPEGVRPATRRGAVWGS